MSIQTKALEIPGERKFPTLEKSNLAFLAIIILGVGFVSQGYCADSSTTEVQQIEAVTKSVMDTIFSPWVRRAALAFGAGAGLFQSYMGGSIKPLLLYGGLGLSVNYVPKIVEVIVKVGS
jgi:hypothetical protein